MSNNVNLVWREVIWHRSFDIDQVTEMLTHLAAMVNRGILVWEARASNGKIRYLIGADSRHIRKITETMSVHGEIEFYETKNEQRADCSSARKLKLSHSNLTLRNDVTESTIRAGLAALAATAPNEETVIQIILGKSYSPQIVPKYLPSPNNTWLDAILGTAEQASPEVRKSVKEKYSEYNFDITIRIGVTNTNASFHIANILSAFKILESGGVRIIDEYEKVSKLNNVHIPWSFPCRLSIQELTPFLLLPAGEEELPGTLGIHPKLTYPPDWYLEDQNPTHMRIFAKSMNPADPKRLSIGPDESKEHTHIIGPTGSGKSTVLLNLILADINAGRSVLVIDPKADLVTKILERIPDSRADDVVVIDPSDVNAVGFNPLALPGDIHLKADAILAVFKEIFADSWGVRSQDVLSAALITLSSIPDATLLWLPQLLTDEDFRERVVNTVEDKIVLKPFWDTFDNLRPAEREQWIAPVLNKMRQFLLRPGLRGILGQANPRFQLTDLFYERKIVLVPLNKGTIGAESARLLGSLIVGLTWTLALSRASIPEHRRRLVSLFIDELQDYLTLPTDLADALAQARGLGVGITMAHQYRAQLPRDLLAGVDANARNKIIFGLSSMDARETSMMAPELSHLDFMSLPRYQVYTNFQYRGRASGWVRGETLPDPPPLHTAADIKALSQTKYGRLRSEVEEDFLKAIRKDDEPESDLPDAPAIGRRRLPEN